MVKVVVSTVADNRSMLVCNCTHDYLFRCISAHPHLSPSNVSLFLPPSNLLLLPYSIFPSLQLDSLTNLSSNLYLSQNLFLSSSLSPTSLPTSLSLSPDLFHLSLSLTSLTLTNHSLSNMTLCAHPTYLFSTSLWSPDLGSLNPY